MSSWVSRAVGLLISALVVGCLVTPDPSLWESPRDSGLDGVTLDVVTELGSDSPASDRPATEGGLVDAPSDTEPNEAGTGDVAAEVAIIDAPIPDQPAPDLIPPDLPLPDLPQPQLAVGDARLFYAPIPASNLYTRIWDQQAGSWSAATTVLSISDPVYWAVNRISPTDPTEEVLALFASGVSGTSLQLVRLTGTAWSADFSPAQGLPAIHADKQSFDLEYESSSGDLLLVYSKNTSTPVYRVRSGGSWSNEQTLPLNDGSGPNPDLNSGTVLWVELTPRAASDIVALLYADSNDDLVAMIWDGGKWLTSSGKTLETDLKANPNSLLVNNRAFDAAFESSSGDLLAAWGRPWTTQGGYSYAVLSASSGSWSAPVEVPVVSGLIELVQLSSDPTADYIAGMFLDQGEGTERLGLAIWNGTDWIHDAEYDSQIRDVNDQAPGDVMGDVAWVGNTGVAVCIYADNQTGTVDWFRGTVTAGWSVQPDVAISGKGYTESVQLQSFPQQNKVMAVVSDDKSQLFSLVYSGTSWTVVNGVPPLGSVSSLQSRPFGFTFRAK